MTALVSQVVQSSTTTNWVLDTLSFSSNGTSTWKI